eukprot:gene786-2536_t
MEVNLCAACKREGSSCSSWKLLLLAHPAALAPQGSCLECGHAIGLHLAVHPQFGNPAPLGSAGSPASPAGGSAQDQQASQDSVSVSRVSSLKSSLGRISAGASLAPLGMPDAQRSSRILGEGSTIKPTVSFDSGQPAPSGATGSADVPRTLSACSTMRLLHRNHQEVQEDTPPGTAAGQAPGQGAPPQQRIWQPRPPPTSVSRRIPGTARPRRPGAPAPAANIAAPNSHHQSGEANSQHRQAQAAWVVPLQLS